MKPINKILCVLMSVLLVLSVAACGEKKQESQKTEETVKREPAAAAAEEVFVDKDGIFDYKAVEFKGPAGYTIVYPEKNKEASEYADLLKDYYKAACDVELKVVSDKSAATAKEILVGKTNRSESNQNIAEGDLEVSVKGDKLVFNAGHNITLKSAVQKFSRLEFEQGKANTFKLTTDFKSTALDGYQYVWGDEFEGNDLDFTRWDFEERMGTTAKIVAAWDEEVIAVDEGRLKLHAVNYFDPLQQNARYKVPYSVVTKYKMNYKYGYAEIRARVPFYQGSWPSFWGLGIGGQGGTKSDGGVAYNAEVSALKKYGVEIDIFEVFGSRSVVTPNVHKWYRPNNYDYAEIHGIEENHTQLYDKSVWDWSKKGVDLETLSNEYHTYGFEWTEKEMNFYVDGEKYYTLDITKSYDEFEDMSGFHDPIFLMFNNHVFADDLDWYENLIDDHTAMPFCYYIDYFRLYQKPNVGEIYIDTTVNSYAGR